MTGPQPGTTGSNTISRAELGAYFRRHGYGQPGDRAMAVFEDIAGHRGPGSEPAGDAPDVTADPMWMHAYRDVQAVLDQALGTEEEDGAGAGIAADVALLASQRDAARAEAVRLEQRLRELTEPGLFAVVPSEDAAGDRSALADADNAIGQVIRLAESWKMAGGQLDASYVTGALLEVCGPWMGGLRVADIKSGSEEGADRG